MSLILSIETSSDICSVALAEDLTILQSINASEKNIHSSRLSLFINELFDKAGIQVNQLDAIAVSRGPGSFTGLRIGVSIAKGIAFGLDIPLIAIDTLKSLTMQVIDSSIPELCYFPLVSARNGEYYYALYDGSLNDIHEVEVVTVDAEQIIRLAGEKQLLIFGDIEEIASDKFLNYPGISFRKGILPDAAYMVPLAFEKYRAKDFEDSETFEPYYLKDFKARKSSKMIKRVLNN